MTGVQTCARPIWGERGEREGRERGEGGEREERGRRERDMWCDGEVQREDLR